MAALRVGSHKDASTGWCWKKPETKDHSAGLVSRNWLSRVWYTVLATAAGAYATHSLQTSAGLRGGDVSSCASPVTSFRKAFLCLGDCLPFGAGPDRIHRGQRAGGHQVSFFRLCKRPPVMCPADYARTATGNEVPSVPHGHRISSSSFQVAGVAASQRKA